MLLQVTALTDPNGIWFFTGGPSGGSCGNALSRACAVFCKTSPASSRVESPARSHPAISAKTFFGFYIQDDWRWKPNLTLNLGLRYEMTSMLTETDGSSLIYGIWPPPLPIWAIRSCEATQPRRILNREIGIRLGPAPHRQAGRPRRRRIV